MYRRLSKNAAYRISLNLLWFLVIFGLPITSFPLLGQLTGAIVAPFSAIPLALLLVFWLVPYVIGGGDFPDEITPLAYFVIIALIVSALAFFLNANNIRGRNFFDQSLRAFVTVGIGLSFYLVFSVFPQDAIAIRQTLVWISIMGALLVPLTLFEVSLLRKYSLVQGFPDWVMRIRSFLAIQSPNVTFTNRVSGFAYEPSWFVRIFNLVLFPIWLSAVYQRKSLFNFRLWIFQVEDFLLIGGLVVFGYSSPRIGLVAFLASVAFIAILFLNGVSRRLTDWLFKNRKQPFKNTRLARIVLALLLVMILFVLAGGALVVYVNAASSWDSRFELLVRRFDIIRDEFFPMTQDNLLYMGRLLAFFERVVFWIGGWEIFNDFPFGVGLGNAGFYFFDRMPGDGLESYEVRNLLYRANYLPNTKSLWTRLLAETGFIGLAMFMVWLYLLWRSSGLIRHSEDRALKILGLAGQLFLLAYLVESFSMDSFAMPYQWVMTGLISAGAVLVRRELATRDRTIAKDMPQSSL
jgi:hypothetical protein